MSWGGNLISAIRFWVFTLGLHDFSRGASSAAPRQSQIKTSFLVSALICTNFRLYGAS